MATNETSKSAIKRPKISTGSARVESSVMETSNAHQVLQRSVSGVPELGAAARSNKSVTMPAVMSSKFATSSSCVSSWLSSLCMIAECSAYS